MKKNFNKVILFLITCFLLIGTSVQAKITTSKIEIAPNLNITKDGYMSRYSDYKYIYFSVSEKMDIYISGSADLYLHCELMKENGDLIAIGYYSNNFSVSRTLIPGSYKIKLKKLRYDQSGYYNINIRETHRYLTVKSSHKSGTYEGPISLELSANTTGSSVYYNIDGSDNGDVLYTEPLNITTNSAISCVAKKVDGTSSERVSFQYKILPKVKEIIIPNDKILSIGDEYKIPVRVYPEEGRLDDLTWKSSDSGVVSVTSDGVISANTTGQAIIFVQKKNSDIKDSCTVNVVESMDGKIVLDIKDAVGEASDEIVIPMTIERLQGSKIGVDGFQFTLEYDTNRLDFLSASIGSIIINENHLTYKELENGKIRFFYVNSTPKRKSITRDGSLINLKFKIKDDVLEGNADILFSTKEKSMFVDRNMKVIDTILQGGFIDIRNYIFGDINNDNTVDESDFSLLERYLVGETQLIMTDSEKRAADVDKNGSIDLLDAMYLQRYILGMIKEFPGEWVK